MNASIKNQIANRLLAVCKTLPGLRRVVRKREPFLLEDVKPALHVVTGAEKVLYEDERGYNCELAVLFQAIFDENRLPFDASDAFEAQLQSVIEADAQLGGLCSKISYRGGIPFIVEHENPVCVVTLMYRVEYRRLRGDATQNY